MDEIAFRNARGEINRRPCIFERALLARHAVCELAANHQIAERESIACSLPAAHADCAQMAELLRESRLTVDAAAHRVGWASRSQAAAMFTRIMGTTPGRYRLYGPP